LGRQLLRCSATEHPDVFAAARVGLGALGVIVEVTLHCVDAFVLRADERPAPLAGAGQVKALSLPAAGGKWPESHRVLTGSLGARRPGLIPHRPPHPHPGAWDPQGGGPHTRLVDAARGRTGADGGRARRVRYGP